MIRQLTIILPGSIRSKKNSKRIFGRGRFKKVLPSEAYCEWEERARNSMELQLPREFKLFSSDDLLHVAVFAYYKGIKPDLSGVLESVGDCLEGIIYSNDKLISSWDGSRLIHDKKNPRTEITIRLYEV